MIRSSHDTMMAGSSSGSGTTHELVWPCPDEPGKAWFILHDEEEVKLWHLLRERTIDGVQSRPYQSEAQGGLGEG